MLALSWSHLIRARASVCSSLVCCSCYRVAIARIETRKKGKVAIRGDSQMPDGLDWIGLVCRVT